MKMYIIAMVAVVILGIAMTTALIAHDNVGDADTNCDNYVCVTVNSSNKITVTRKAGAGYSSVLRITALGGRHRGWIESGVSGSCRRALHDRSRRTRGVGRGTGGGATAAHPAAVGSGGAGKGTGGIGVQPSQVA